MKAGRKLERNRNVAERNDKGRFVKGNTIHKLGVIESVKKPRPGTGFRQRLVKFFEHPDNVTLLEEKIRKDLKGDGPATFAQKALAYAYGEPRQTIEFEMRGVAAKLAAEAGVTVEELLAEATRVEELQGAEPAPVPPSGVN